MRFPLALAIVISATGVVEAQVAKPVRTIAISVTEIPNFDEVFQSIRPWAMLPTAAPKVVSPPPRAEAPKKEAPKRVAERKRVVASAGRLERYCARPGKDQYSWIRVKGNKLFCPA